MEIYQLVLVRAPDDAPLLEQPFQSILRMFAFLARPGVAVAQAGYRGAQTGLTGIFSYASAAELRAGLERVGKQFLLGRPGRKVDVRAAGHLATLTRADQIVAEAAQLEALDSVHGAVFTAAAAPTLLIASGWKDDLAAYQDLTGQLTQRGWRTAIVGLPQESAKFQTRRHHLQLLEAAADDLFGIAGSSAESRVALRCLLGFSYGGYLGVLLSRTRRLDAMVLRSPAMYGDKGWDVPKDELDEQKIDVLRHEDLDPSDSQALAAASEFNGQVALFECEFDDVVPHQTHVNYNRAFSSKRPCHWEVIQGADHPLKNPKHRAEFYKKTADWLEALRPV